MKKLWSRFSIWFDARKDREQWVVLLAAVAVTAALLDALLLSPTLSRRAAAERGIANLQNQVREAQAQLVAARAAQANDPNAVIRARIDALKRTAAEIDRSMEERATEFVTPERVRPLLERVLAGRPSLQLVELRTLDPVPIQGAAPAAPAGGGAPTEAEAAQAAANRPGLFRHGLEIAVRGNYGDLVDYLRELEKLPVRIYWGRIDLVAETWPNSVIRLTLHTLSLERTWLSV